MEGLKSYLSKHRDSLDDKIAPSELWSKIAQQLDNKDLNVLIDKSSEAFSEKEPSNHLWYKIENKLSSTPEYKKSKVVPMSYLWKMVAMFTLILVATVWFLLQNENIHNYNPITMADDDEKSSLEEIDADLQEAELYYESLISLKKMELANFDLVSYGLQNDFNQDIDKLDAAYEEIKEEVLSGNTNVLLIKAMIDNLQLRVEILTRQLTILNQLQQTHQQNEKHTIQL